MCVTRKGRATMRHSPLLWATAQAHSKGDILAQKKQRYLCLLMQHKGL